jgi:hypothetical protein
MSSMDGQPTDVPAAPPAQVPDQPEHELEGPYTDRSWLRDRPYVPVDEWQISDAETADIGYWGGNPLPKYTSDLPEKEAKEAEKRIAAQVELAGKQGAQESEADATANDNAPSSAPGKEPQAGTGQQDQQS